MTVWNIIALVIGGIVALACLALACFGLGVVILLCSEARKEYEVWKNQEMGG